METTGELLRASLRDLEGKGGSNAIAGFVG